MKRTGPDKETLAIRQTKRPWLDDRPEELDRRKQTERNRRRGRKTYR